MTLRVHDHVRYIDRYAARRACTCRASEPSSFDGLTGKVTQVKPHVMVLLDGERFPMLFDERDLDRLDVDPSSPNLTGAE